MHVPIGWFIIERGNIINLMHSFHIEAIIINQLNFSMNMQFSLFFPHFSSSTIQNRRSSLDHKRGENTMPTIIYTGFRFSSSAAVA